MKKRYKQMEKKNKKTFTDTNEYSGQNGKGAGAGVYLLRINLRLCINLYGFRINILS